MRVMMNAPFGEALLGARCTGKMTGQFRGDGIDGAQELAEFFGGVTFEDGAG